MTFAQLLPKHLGQTRIGTLQILLTMFGILLAAQVNFIQQGWITKDFVLYFETARLFGEGEWQQAFNLYEWPLFPLLIAALNKLTGLGIHTSAQLLCIGLFGIATWSFLKLIQVAGGDRSAVVAGALILFSSQYIVGDILPMLVRDQGFWAFFLASLVFFIRFYQTNTYSNALLWQLSAMIATLFRIEAITFLIALPFVLLFNWHNTSWAHRLKLFLKAHTLNILIALVVGTLLLSGLVSTEYMGRLREVFTFDLYEKLTRNLFAHAEIMGSQVLGEHLEDFSIEGLLVTFVYVMVVKTLSASGLIASALAIYAATSWRKHMNTEAMQVLSGAMLIALANMFLIITKVFVLSGRYVIPFALLLMVFATFGLVEGYRQVFGKAQVGRTRKWLFILALVIMTLGLIKNVLPKRAGYNYEQEAIAWVRDHNPQQAPVYYDTARLRYYAGASYIGRADHLFWPHLQAMAQNGQVDEYHFLLVNIEQDNEEKKAADLEKLPQFRELKRFYDPRQKKAIAVFGKTDADVTNR